MHRDFKTYAKCFIVNEINILQLILSDRIIRDICFTKLHDKKLKSCVQIIPPTMTSITALIKNINVHTNSLRPTFLNFLLWFQQLIVQKCSKFILLNLNKQNVTFTSRMSHTPQKINIPAMSSWRRRELIPSTTVPEYSCSLSLSSSLTVASKGSAKLGY